MSSFALASPIEKQNEEYWLTRDVVCAIPVHLDTLAVFGTAIFIVMSNATRYEI